MVSAWTPRQLSKDELERVTRRFVDELHDVIGPHSDIPAPDMGTNFEVMAWMRNQWEKYHGFNPAVVTGKPVEHYGAEGREEATGRGVGILTFKTLKRLGRRPNETSVAIQGFGNVGSHAAKFLTESDFRVVAVSDLSGAYYRPEGLDIQHVLRYQMLEDRSLNGYTGSRSYHQRAIAESGRRRIDPRCHWWSHHCRQCRRGEGRRDHRGSKRANRA